jgi:hypothetical protein
MPRASDDFPNSAAMQANRIADVAQRQPRLLRPLKALAPRLAGGLDIALVGELRPPASAIAFSFGSFGIDRNLNAEHGDTFRQ